MTNVTAAPSDETGAKTLTEKQAVEAMKNSGTGFIKNVGQVYDYDKNPAPYVLYSLTADKSAVFLTENGLTYSLVERERIKDERALSGSLKNQSRFGDKNVARLDMILSGASIKKENVSENEYANDVAINYYGGGLHEDALNRRACKQITVKEIYPHIDWVLKITADQKFKYDFVVHPGGNPKDIKAEFKGATKMLLNETKNTLTLSTPLGDIVDGKLYCYTQEDGKTVDANYNLNKQNLSLNIDKYDIKKTLIVDPLVYMALTWSTFYGGGSTGGGGGTVLNAIKTDDVNNRVYVVGYCYSSPFPNLNNGTAYYSSPSQAGTTIEAIISAFDLTGVQKWATYFMSTEYDGASDVTVDGLGNIYMVGTTEWHGGATVNFPTLQYGTGFIQSSNNGTGGIYQDGFIVRFDKNGVLKWSTLFGGNKADNLYGVSCDASNNVVICGTTNSNASVPVQNAGGYYQSALSGAGTNGVIAMFDVNTAKKWATYFGNSGTDAREIECDFNNNIYVTGLIGNNVGFPFVTYTGGYNKTTAGSYISYFTSATAQKWCSSFEPGQNIADISVNQSDGNILVGGSTVSSTSSSYWVYPSNGAGGTYPTYWDNSYNGGSYDGFVLLIDDATYGILWSTLLGGNGEDQVAAASISKNGRMFVTGYTNTSGLGAPGTFPTVNTGGSAYYEGNMVAGLAQDIFISYFESKNGSTTPTVSPYYLEWSTLFGDNTGQETPYDLDISSKYLFLCGTVLLEPNTPSFPLLHEPSGFLQNASNPIVTGFNPSGGNGLILKFFNEGNFNLKSGILSSDKNFSVYPNPSIENFITIKSVSNNLGKTDFVIYDVYGKEVKRMNVQNFSDNSIQIDLTGLIPGCYFIKYSSGLLNGQLPFVKL